MAIRRGAFGGPSDGGGAQRYECANEGARECGAEPEFVADRAAVAGKCG